MLFNLLLLRGLYVSQDESPPSKKQPARKLNEQSHPLSLRHHHDAIESLRQLHQRYYLDRRVF